MTAIRWSRRRRRAPVRGFALLGRVFVLSSLLDDIAAALIGATVAKVVFPTAHIGYLAAIVAASNAGGAGSVAGDTTTTMMWIDGVSPLDVTHAYAAAVPALLVIGLWLDDLVASLRGARQLDVLA